MQYVVPPQQQGFYPPQPVVVVQQPQPVYVVQPQVYVFFVLLPIITNCGLVSLD